MYHITQFRCCCCLCWGGGGGLYIVEVVYSICDVSHYTVSVLLLFVLGGGGVYCRDSILNM